MSSETDFSIETAREAATLGQLAEWVEGFLRSPGSDNEELAEQLERTVGSWIGPLRLPMDRLHRLAGPSGQPTLGRLDDEDREVVTDMAAEVADGWEPPPVVVVYRNGQLVVEDGNHRIESLRRTGRSHVRALVGFEDEDARERFEQVWLSTGETPTEGKPGRRRDT
jgi:hypothetical protein